MNRRKFVKQKLMATTALGLGATGLGLAAEKSSALPLQTNFKLKYAPHLGMFKNHAGDDPIDQLNFMADQGFTAFEDNGMKGRSIQTQEKMASTMAKRNMTMGVFVAHEIYWKEPNLANGDPALLEKFLKEIQESVEVAKRVNAKWMTVVPGHIAPRLNMAYQTTNVVEALKRASDILEPHGLTMVLEPLNFRDHPGLFLSESPQAYAVCKSVNSPSCKILFDIYHQQIQEGNLIPNIDACWNEIAYFQVGDNPGRNEPTTGEINYKNVFKHIHSKGFKGVLGMEHGNSKQGKEGELAVIEAYKVSDTF
ncbi:MULTISPECIES: hydroxypyruvate isomerase family protein [Flavobacteriaceae]|uniref:Xylose isomerase n=1 Tax=Flagellimonas alvinocaridis TaxID=2530200 RepID=A0A4V4HX08_9FLAO|nr:MULTISPECIES: TIM barrel protein [Allomuricauda]MDC6361290.1 TIM barrel protein [Muricauda sp. SP22]THV59216.1 xylose isomerase [Allomuricauda alvinocaridis]